MIIARKGLKVVVSHGQANAVGPTSIEGSFLLVREEIGKKRGKMGKERRGDP